MSCYFRTGEMSVRVPRLVEVGVLQNRSQVKMVVRYTKEFIQFQISSLEVLLCHLKSLFIIVLSLLLIFNTCLMCKSTITIYLELDILCIYIHTHKISVSNTSCAQIRLIHGPIYYNGFADLFKP